MVLLYELLIGLGLALGCWLLWRSGLVAGRAGGALLVAVPVAYVAPLLWRADWALLGQVGLGAAIVAVPVLAYVYLIRRIRRAVEEREGEGE